MTSILSRNTVAIVLVATALAAFTTAPAAAQVRKSKGNGAYISASGSDASGCVWSEVYVSRTGTKAAPQTWMYYYAYNACSGEWIAYGDGLIANASLKTTQKGATLTVTPTTSANFYAAGSAGSMQITLTADGAYSHSYSGHSRTEYGGHVYQSHGAWTSQSATATGTVFGMAFGNMHGTLGEGRDRYMEIDRGSK